MTPDFFFWTALTALVCSMLAATASQSMHQLAVHELEEYCRYRNRMNVFRRIIEWREWLTVGAESFRVVSTVVSVSSATIWLLAQGGIDVVKGPGFLLPVAGMAATLVIVNSWIPFAVAQSGSTFYIYHSWRIWWIVSFLSWPIIVGSNLLSNVFQRAAGNHDEEDGEEEWLEDEIRSIVSEGERGGLIESGERDMIEGVMELDENDVFSVMTPRSRVDSLDSNTEWSKAVDFVVRSGRTRVPVYEGRIDNIIGVLFAKDLLRESMLNPELRRPLRELLRPPLTVPESIMLNEMLQKFLREHTHLAIVLDEYGAFSGIVTIEDILEEIVGEIVDETDRESPVQIVQTGAGTAYVDGLARIDEVNEELGTEIPEDEDFDTIAGWIMNRSKQIPRPGTALIADNIQIKILRSTRRMIEQVELKVLSNEELVSNRLAEQSDANAESLSST